MPWSLCILEHETATGLSTTCMAVRRLTLHTLRTAYYDPTSPEFGSAGCPRQCSRPDIPQQYILASILAFDKFPSADSLKQVVYFSRNSVTGDRSSHSPWRNKQPLSNFNRLNESELVPFIAYTRHGGRVRRPRTVGLILWLVVWLFKRNAPRGFQFTNRPQGVGALRLCFQGQAQ